MWGLTQEHGRPCGVLAALQAEAIRVLLFGSGGGRRDLRFPFEPRSDSNYGGCKAAPVTAAEANEAIAMAPGMLLARAATSPPASRRAKGGVRDRRRRSLRPAGVSGR